MVETAIEDFPFVPYADCCESEEGSSTIQIGTGSYELRQDLDFEHFSPIFSDAWTGTEVWEASILLSQYIDQERIELAGKRVIELGSGW